MKVILTQEVKGRGHEGDVIDVARGFAVNYLLPRKMAIEATQGNLKQLEARMANIEKRNSERRSDAEGVAAAIDGKTVTIEAKAGDEGKLFGSVTTTMIEEAVEAQLGHDVDHRRMDLGRPIKEIGEFDVRVSVYGDVSAILHVNVVAEGGVPAPAPEAKKEPEAVEETEEAAQEPVLEEGDAAPEAEAMPETSEEPAAEEPADE